MESVKSYSCEFSNFFGTCLPVTVSDSLKPFSLAFTFIISCNLYYSFVYFCPSNSSQNERVNIHFTILSRLRPNFGASSEASFYDEFNFVNLRPSIRRNSLVENFQLYMVRSLEIASSNIWYIWSASTYLTAIEYFSRYLIYITRKNMSPAVLRQKNELKFTKYLKFWELLFYLVL